MAGHEGRLSNREMFNCIISVTVTDATSPSGRADLHTICFQPPEPRLGLIELATSIVAEMAARARELSCGV
jgi:hypothetical protein